MTTSIAFSSKKDFKLFAYELKFWAGALCLLNSLKGVALAQAQSDSATAPAEAQSSPAENVFDFKFGPFTLHPWISTGVAYNDNILFTVDNPEKDVIWSIQPAIQAVAGDDAALLSYRDRQADFWGLTPGSLIIRPQENWTGRLFILQYDPDYRFYQRYSANNFFNQYANLNLLWPMNKLILGLKEDYKRERTTIIEAGQLANIENSFTTLSAAFQFGLKTSWESNLRLNYVDYDNQQLTGYTELSAENWLNYEVAPDVTASLGAVVGVDEVDHSQNQDFQQLRVRARYFYTEKLNFDASVGVEVRQYENGHGDTAAPVFSVSGEYKPAERTDIRLSASRQRYASIVNSLVNGEYYDSTGVSLNMRQGITDRFAASASASFYVLDYTPINAGVASHSDDYYSFQVGLEAKIVRHLVGTFYYQWLNRESDVDGNIGQNQAGVRLTLRF
jgi:hypothetical protein